MSTVNTNNFAKVIKIVTDIVSKLNREGTLRIPAQKPKHSELDRFASTETIAILIGEQHQGASYKRINFNQSNRTITELVLQLFNNETLNLNSIFQEGISELKIHPELEKLNKEEFLLHQASPLVSLIHLVKKNNGLKVSLCESLDLFIEFALLSLLHTSLPGVSEFPEQEMTRIKNILNHYESDHEINAVIYKLCNKINLEFRLNKLLEAKLLRQIQIGTINFYEFNQRAQVNQEINNLGYLLSHALKNKLKARDEYISERIAQAGTGIHSLLIGELHLENLRKSLEAQNIGVISLSAFT